MKKFNFLSLLLAGLLFLSFSSTSVSALSEENSSHLLVTKYLNALKDKDIPEVVKISVDERVNSKLDYQIEL